MKREDFITKQKERYPDTADWQDDDEMFEDIDGRFSKGKEDYDTVIGERDEIKGKYDGFAPMHERMVEIAKEKPHVIMAISDALENGGEFSEGDDSGIGDRAKQYAELLKDINESTDESLSEGLKTSAQAIDNYIAEQGLDEQEAQELNDQIVKAAISFLDGSLSQELVSLIHRGIIFDDQMQEAYETGKSDGLNDKQKKVIELKKLKVANAPAANNEPDKISKSTDNDFFADKTRIIK